MQKVISVMRLEVGEQHDAVETLQVCWLQGKVSGGHLSRSLRGI